MLAKLSLRTFNLSRWAGWVDQGVGQPLPHRMGAFCEKTISQVKISDSDHAISRLFARSQRLPVPGGGVCVFQKGGQVASMISRNLSGRTDT
jgi:hypothetical protein